MMSKSWSGETRKGAAVCETEEETGVVIQDLTRVGKFDTGAMELTVFAAQVNRNCVAWVKEKDKALAAWRTSGYVSIEKLHFMNEAGIADDCMYVCTRIAELVIDGVRRRCSTSLQ